MPHCEVRANALPPSLSPFCLFPLFPLRLLPTSLPLHPLLLTCIHLVKYTMLPALLPSIHSTPSPPLRYTMLPVLLPVYTLMSMSIPM